MESIHLGKIIHVWNEADGPEKYEYEESECVHCVV